MKSYPQGRRIILTRVWLALGLVLACGLGQMRGDERPAALWPHEESDLKADPQARWGRLANGVGYVLLPNAEPPKRITLRLYVRAGSLMENDEQQGLAHFLEHMAFNGTKNFPSGKLVKYLQLLGIEFGPDVNAHTSFDETVYDLELPGDSEELVEDGLRLLGDYAGGMLLERGEIDRERGVVLNEMRLRDGVDYRIGKAWMAFQFPEALMARRWPIGVEGVLKTAPPERFVEFYRTWYRPELLVLVAVGHLDPEAFAKRVEVHFGSLAAAGPAPKAPVLGTVAPIAGHVKLHFESEARAVEVGLSAVRPHPDVPDSLSRRTRILEVGLANQMFSRRLEILAKKEGAPFYRPEVGYHTLFRFAEMAGAGVSCDAARWEAALGVIEQELRRALRFGFRESELREARAKQLNALERAVERASTRKSPMLANAIVSRLGDREVFQDPAQELAVFGPIVKQITPDRCAAAFRQAWGDETPAVFVSGNLKLERGDEAVTEAMRKSRAEDVKPPAESEEQKFAYTNFGPAGTVAHRVTHDDLGVTQVHFANGVRLNLKRTDFEAGSISLLVRFGGGVLELPKDRIGLNILARETFVEGGLEKHSADDLERIFAGRDVGAKFAVGDDSFGFSAQTSPKDLGDELGLLAAYLVAPGYRPESLRQAREEFAEQYRVLRTTLEGVMEDRFPRFLASDDWRFGWPPEAALSARTLDELREWMRAPLSSGYLEISLVGDLDIEKTISLVGGTFGALPRRADRKPEFADRRAVAFPSGEREKLMTYQSEISRGAMALCWAGPDMYDIRKVRRLNVLMSILDDRLRVKIREEMGEAYAVGAGVRPSDTYRGYGLIIAQTFTDPEKLEKIADAIGVIVNELQRGGVTEDELQRAIRPTLEAIDKQRRTNRYWLSQVLGSSQEYPQRLDWAREMVEDHRSIKREEIDALAREYLVLDRSVKILCQPEKPEAAGGASRP